MASFWPACDVAAFMHRSLVNLAVVVVVVVVVVDEVAVAVAGR